MYLPALYHHTSRSERRTALTTHSTDTRDDRRHGTEEHCTVRQDNRQTVLCVRVRVRTADWSYSCVARALSTLTEGGGRRQALRGAGPSGPARPRGEGRHACPLDLCSVTSHRVAAIGPPARRVGGSSPGKGSGLCTERALSLRIK